jgi:hypothetical protein
MSDEKPFEPADVVWDPVAAAAGKLSAVAVWQDSVIADRIAAYLMDCHGTICPAWRKETILEPDGERPDECAECGFSRADHLLRDAHRALRKLTVFRLDEEPVKVGEQLTVRVETSGVAEIRSSAKSE